MCIPLSSRLTCSCRQGAGCRRLGVLLQSRAGSYLPCTLIPQRPKGADWVKPMSLVWWAVVSLVSAQRHDSHYKNVRFSHVPGALKHQRLRVSRTQALGGQGGCMEQDLSSVFLADGCISLASCHALPRVSHMGQVSADTLFGWISIDLHTAPHSCWEMQRWGRAQR